MKRYISILLTICLTITLFGCSQESEKVVPETTEDMPGTTLTTDVTEQVLSEPVNLDGPMTAVSLAAEETTVVAEDGTPIFQYTRQNIALTLSAQATADRVILDFLNRADAVNATADTMISTAESDYANNPSGWIPYFCQSLYDPTRIDRGVLSLFGKVVTFTGGFHPEITCVSANYDLLTGDVLTLGSILTGEDAIDDICELVISQLNEIAEEKYIRSGFESDVRTRFAAEISYDEERLRPNEDGIDIKQEFNILPDTERLVCALYVGGRFRPEEIAQFTGLSLSTVKKKLDRALTAFELD